MAHELVKRVLSLGFSMPSHDCDYPELGPVCCPALLLLGCVWLGRYAASLRKEVSYIEVATGHRDSVVLGSTMLTASHAGDKAAKPARTDRVQQQGADVLKGETTDPHTVETSACACIGPERFGRFR